MSYKIPSTHILDSSDVAYVKKSVYTMAAEGNSIVLDDTLSNANKILSVNVENHTILSSEYSLGVDGKTLTLTENIPAGYRVETTYIMDGSIDAPGDGSAQNINKFITNSVLQVPQRVVVVGNADNTLTIKKDSVVIVPNGFESDGVTEKYEYYSLPSDINGSADSASYDRLVGVYTGESTAFQGKNTIYRTSMEICFSGPAEPTATQYALWYDTANNLVKRYTGTEWLSGYSLPVSHASWINGALYIHNIFNGFGFVGSTIFVDKDVKFLIPNGRNTDGSLRNSTYLTPSLKKYQKAYTNGDGNLSQIVEITSAGEIHVDNKYLEVEHIENLHIAQENHDYALIYDISENYFYRTGQNGTITTEKCPFAVFALDMYGSTSTTQISSMQFLGPTPLLDRNDRKTICRWSKPSDKYFELTPPASENAPASFTARANGVVSFVANTTSANTYIRLMKVKEPGNKDLANIERQSICWTPNASSTLSAELSVKEGDFYIADRNANGTYAVLRFYLDEGEL